MSLDTERLKHRGRLAEKENDARLLALRIEGMVISIRDLLDPFEKTEDLRVDMAAIQAVELAGSHAEYLGLLKEIAAIKKALGV
jgi:deoxyadenosine/deoxycytidine kinase